MFCHVIEFPLVLFVITELTLLIGMLFKSDWDGFNTDR